MRTLAALSLALLAGTASAADVRISDLRLALGVTPGPRDIDVDFSPGAGSPGSAGSGSTTAQSGQALDLNAAFIGGELFDHGFVYGIGLDLARGSFNPRGVGGGDMDYATVMPQVRAGYAYAFSTSFHIELTPFIGYGLAMTEWVDGSSTDTGYGTALTYGILAGGHARMGRGWRLGGEAGWQGGIAEVSVTNDTTKGESDLTLTSSGVLARIAASYQF
jgi:hypothetical protein